MDAQFISFENDRIVGLLVELPSVEPEKWRRITPEDQPEIERFLADPIGYSQAPIRTLKSVKEAKIREIKANCTAQIESGFRSNALSTEHIYDSDEQAQMNLTQAVLLGTDLPYTCTDLAGEKRPRLHTIAQLRQVLSDGGAVKLGLIGRYHQIKAQILQADSIEAVEAIAW